MPYTHCGELHELGTIDILVSGLQVNGGEIAERVGEAASAN